MNAILFDGYSEFECIGGECPDTCCGGWSIDIDEETYRYYENLNTEFGKKLIESIHVNGEKRNFILNEEGKCKFLDEHKLCSVYKELGPDKMCATCQIYPRNVSWNGGMVFYHDAISCPVVAKRIIEKSNPLQIDFVETQFSRSPVGEYDADKFGQIMQSFGLCFDILQNRKYRITDRVRLFLLYNKMLQESMEKGNASETAQTDSFFADEANWQSAIGITTNMAKGQIAIKMQLMKRILTETSAFRTDARLLDIVVNFSEYIKNGFDSEKFESCVESTLTGEHELEYENLLCYFLFAKYVEIGMHHDVYSAATEIVMLFLIHHYTATMYYAVHGELLKEEMILISYLLGRSIEQNHGARGIVEFVKTLQKEGFTQLSRILETL